MRYLLDTSAYYLVRRSPELLGRIASQILTSGGHELFISVLTPWELAIKAGIGKLVVANMLIDFEQRETAAGFTMTPITTLQAVASGLLPSHHRDPFDRLLIAQAFDLRVPILSSDKMLDLYGVQRIWD